MVYGVLLSRSTQAASPVTVRNLEIIGRQTNSHPSVSRDGGVSVMLNEKVLWLFDDTTTTDPSGELVSFSSNTAAIALDPGNVTAIQDIIRPATSASSSQVVLQDDASSQTGGWIPLSSSELAFNQKQTWGARTAICESTVQRPGFFTY